MFGRRLKKEFKLREYRMINESNNTYANTKYEYTKYTRIEDPIMTMGGVIGISFFTTLFILYSILPRLGMIIPETICHLIIVIVVVASTDIGYIIITEPDDTTNEE